MAHSLAQDAVCGHASVTICARCGAPNDVGAQHAAPQPKPIANHYPERGQLCRGAASTTAPQHAAPQPKPIANHYPERGQLCRGAASTTAQPVTQHLGPVGDSISKQKTGGAASMTSRDASSTNAHTRCSIPKQVGAQHAAPLRQSVVRILPLDE